MPQGVVNQQMKVFYRLSTLFLALRPLALLNLLPWLLAGVVWTDEVADTEMRQAIGLALWLLGLAMTIVGSNDYVDRARDGGERTLISGGSGMIQSGRLLPRDFIRMAQVGVVLILLASTILIDRPWVFGFSVVGLFLVWIYHFPPLELTLRPSGAFVQMIGTALVLPLMGYYVIAPVEMFSRMNRQLVSWLFMSACCFALAAHVTTALPDVERDKYVGKRTIAVALGQGKSQLLTISASMLGVFSFGRWQYRMIGSPSERATLLWSTVVLMTFASAVAVGKKLRSHNRHLPLAFAQSVVSHVTLIVFPYITYLVLYE